MNYFETQALKKLDEIINLLKGHFNMGDIHDTT